MIIKKGEIMKDLKFCQELMDRLVEFADECNANGWYIEKYTVLQNDIIRLRRELNKVNKKLKE